MASGAQIARVNAAGSTTTAEEDWPHVVGMVVAQGAIASFAVDDSITEFRGDAIAVMARFHNPR